MSLHRLENCIVDTDKSTKQYEESTDWNGNNWISRATGSQWHHQTLYRSRKGRYYIINSSNYEGSSDTAEWLSPQEATRWLLLMGHDLPSDLMEFEDQVSE